MLFKNITTGHNNKTILSNNEDYLVTVREDLIISNEWINNHDESEPAYSWYKQHIAWLESEINLLSK